MAVESMSTATDLNALMLDPLSGSEADVLAALDKMYGGDATEVATTGTDESAAVKQAAPSSTQADTTTSATADAGNTGASQDQQQQGEVQGDQAAGIATKDGKAVIPYHVLSETRERATRAELRIQEMAEELEALKAAKPGASADVSSDLAASISAEDLAALREESPALAAVIDGMQAQLAAQNARIEAAAKPAAELQREQAVQRAVSAQEMVEQALADNPKLLHLRTHDAQRFNEIAALDGHLRARPEWADKPMADRFAAAIRAHEALNGEIQMPAAPGAARAAPTAQQAKVDVAGKVAAAVAQAHQAAAGPSTLSDISGGATPPGSDAEAIEDISAAALAQQFMNMTPQQIDAQLARIGGG